MKKQLPKIAVIVGPTASGKTELGIALAKKFNGEVVSADSRQVYKEMDIATAKPEGKRMCGKFIVDGVPHYLIDIIKPDRSFSLADYKKKAVAAINNIIHRGKLPIIIGGTGLYIWAVVDNLDIPAVAPDTKLRARLEKLSLPALVKLLKKNDPVSSRQIDLHNPRRVVRALEVALAGGKPFVQQKKVLPPLYDALQIGIRMPREALNERINVRVDRQMAAGLEEETKKLAAKYGWGLPSMSGIGYRQIGYCLRGEKNMADAAEMIKRDTRRYAKRQMTWFKRDRRIRWVDYRRVRAQSAALTKKFLRK